MIIKKRNLDLKDIVFAGVKSDRAADNLRVYHSDNCGATTYRKKRVATVSAPMVRGAIARTIRIHELLHANRSPVTKPRKVHPIAANAVEDARVHSTYWPQD